MNKFIILFFLGLVVYSNSFANKFLIDDYAFLANPTINSTKYLLAQFSPYQQLTHIVDLQEWVNLVYYRPLAHIVPAICYSMFGEHYWRYHLFNLTLFVLASFLIYLCVLRLSKNDALAFLTSVFYIIHPINGIMVNYITASIFSIQVIFILSSILCLWESIGRKDNRPLYYLGLLSMALALLCHETSIMAPFYLGAVLVVTGCVDLKKLIKCLTPFFLVLLAYLVFRSYCVSLNDTVLHKMLTYKMNFFEYGATLFTLITWYIGQLFFPNGIVLVWGTPIIRSYIGPDCLGILGIVSFFIASFIYFRRQKIVQIGLMWLLIGFFPMLAAPFSRPYDGADIEPHWFAFSSIGFFIFIAHCFLSVCPKKLTGRNLITGALLICMGTSWIISAHRYNRLWSDEMTYTRYWATQSPQIKSIYEYLANSYRMQGDLKNARKNFLLALTGSPNDQVIFNNLGLIEKREGHYKAAESYFQACLKMLPNFENYANLGGLYLINGKLGAARECYVRALIRSPDELPLLEALISISIRTNDIPALNRYIKLYLEKEKSPKALMRFGDVMAQDGFFDVALKSYQHASVNNLDYDQIQELIVKEKELLRLLQVRP